MAKTNLDVPYEKDTDYMALMQADIADGNFAAAAYHEQQRNAKIDGEGLNYAKTDTAQRLWERQQRKTERDDTSYSPPDYDKYETAVRRASGMNYDNWIKSSAYQNLLRRYAANGRMTMDDTVGKIAARTDGLASSYAASAANGQYDRYMQDFEDAARKQYAQERGDAVQDANLAKALADEAYSRYDHAYNYARQDASTARSEAKKAIERILRSGGTLLDLDVDLIRKSGMTSAELQAILREAAARS